MFISRRQHEKEMEELRQRFYDEKMREEYAASVSRELREIMKAVDRLESRIAKLESPSEKPIEAVTMSGGKVPCNS